MARDRHDGTAIPDLHPIRRIMPFLMPTRNGAFVLFEQAIPVAPIDAFLTRANASRPTDRPITLFHCVLRAIGVALAEFPRLNRFVVGSRVYQRRAIELAFSAKQRLERDAPLFTAKVVHRPDEALDALVDRVVATVDAGRAGTESRTDREVSGLLRLPGGVLRMVLALQRRLDAWNLLPAALTRDDPLYASAFVANLGSVGLDAAYHHLYEYGTIPVFVTIGRVHHAPYVHGDGSVRSREIVLLRWTYDERVEDGFYAARALERIEALLARPDALG